MSNAVFRKTLLPLAFCTVLAQPALSGVPFDQMIVFGASYEDNGQFPDIDFLSVAAPGLVPPPGAGLDGSTGFRFTNLVPDSGMRDRSWIEKLSANLGIGGLVPSTPLLFPGERTDTPDTQNINFAFGGARSSDQYQAVVGESVTVHPIDDAVEADLSASSPGLAQRLASGELTITRRTLFMVNPAGNDVRDASIENPAADGVAAASNTLAMIDALAGLGAHTIISPSFPPLGESSESSNVAADGSRTPKAEARNIATNAYNAALAEGLQSSPGNIVAVDLHGLLMEVLADPGSFGLNAQVDHSRYCYSASDFSITGVNCTEAPGLGKSSGGSPDDFLFNDGLHPTGFMTSIYGDYAESILRAPGMIALLPEASLADARAFGNTVFEYQAGRRWSPQPSGFDFFASVQGQDIDYEDGNSTPAASSDAVDLTLGVTMELNDNWFVGGAVGSQEGDTQIDNAGSEFDSSTLIGSIFLGYRHDFGFVDFTLTAGSTDLDDIKRVVPLGTHMVRTETGDTEADILGIGVVFGLDVTAEQSALRFGPYVSLDYTNIDVDGYEEKGSDATAMVFGDQERDSYLGSAGVFANYPFRWGDLKLQAYGDIAYRKELEDDSDAVQAVVKNLASGVRFRMPGYDIDDTSIIGRAGIGANFGALRCNLYGSYEDNDRETTYLGLSVAYDL